MTGNKILAIGFVALVLVAIGGMPWWRRWTDTLDWRIYAWRNRKASRREHIAARRQTETREIEERLRKAGEQLAPQLSIAERERVYLAALAKATAHRDAEKLINSYRDGGSR